eukprot:8324768-Pyramimonas_sp.AAC.1
MGPPPARHILGLQDGLLHLGDPVAVPLREQVLVLLVLLAPDGHPVACGEHLLHGLHVVIRRACLLPYAVLNNVGIRVAPLVLGLRLLLGHRGGLLVRLL